MDAVKAKNANATHPKFKVENVAFHGGIPLAYIRCRTPDLPKVTAMLESIDITVTKSTATAKPSADKNIQRSQRNGELTAAALGNKADMWLNGKEFGIPPSITVMKNEDEDKIPAIIKHIEEKVLTAIWQKNGLPHNHHGKVILLQYQDNTRNPYRIKVRLPLMERKIFARNSTILTLNGEDYGFLECNVCCSLEVLALAFVATEENGLMCTEDDTEKAFNKILNAADLNPKDISPVYGKGGVLQQGKLVTTYNNRSDYDDIIIIMR
jgi:hypothetical protein